MRFRELKKKLRELELNRFTTNDVRKITQQNNNTVNTFLRRQEKKGNIFRIKKGKYSLEPINNKYEAASAYKDSYISLWTALEYYRTTTQLTNTLDLITKNNHRKQETENIIIKFHKIKEELFFGYIRAEIKGTDCLIADKEKTIIDCIYFSNIVYLKETEEFIKQMKNEINIQRLKKYLKKIDSSVLNKRIGYIMEKQGITLSNLKMNDKYEKLNINLGMKGKKNKTWKLIINEEL